MTRLYAVAAYGIVMLKGLGAAARVLKAGGGLTARYTVIYRLTTACQWKPASFEPVAQI